MNDHKPNRRARRALQRVGNKIAERIIERKAIQKVERDEPEQLPDRPNE